MSLHWALFCREKWFVKVHFCLLRIPWYIEEHMYLRSCWRSCSAPVFCVTLDHMMFLSVSVSVSVCSHLSLPLYFFLFLLSLFPLSFCLLYLCFSVSQNKLFSFFVCSMELKECFLCYLSLMEFLWLTLYSKDAMARKDLILLWWIRWSQVYGYYFILIE